jgi:predicted DNA-binding protein (MmcQ/YjbR family)
MRRVNASKLHKLCLQLPSAREEFPFGPETSVFKVGGKLFALSALAAQPLSVSVKCDPDLGEQLRFSYPEIIPGYHLNKRHWLTLTVDGALPDNLVVDLIGGSYELVVASLSRALRDTLTPPSN